MFFYLQFLILRLPDMLLIDSHTVSELSFTNSTFTGVFSTPFGTNDNIKKIRTIARKMCRQIECFINNFKCVWITCATVTSFVITFKNSNFLDVLILLQCFQQLCRYDVPMWKVYSFGMFRVIRRKRKAPVCIGWYICIFV